MAKREPVFLDVERILELHHEQTAKYGGSLGVRDMGLLESAVHAASTTFGGAFLHRDLAEMAGAYLFHIVKNHPFIDGNKRTGAMTAFVFLEINGVDFSADEQEFTDVVLACATGEASKEQVIDFFRRNIPAELLERFDAED